MNRDWLIVFIFCLTLGLAPWWINGEPHIIGKIRWVLGGAEEMVFLDYFDLALHGSPWVFLIIKAARDFMLKKKKKKQYRHNKDRLKQTKFRI